MSGVRETALTLRKIERRLDRLERTGSLTYSSIDDGALDVTDGDGATTMSIGKQFDDTFAVAPFIGPPPPQPTDPVCTPQLSAVNVTWDGFFADGSLTPMDFARVEVHASPDAGDLADTADTIIGTFETPRGGTQVFPVPTPGTNYVRLVARTQSGKSSTPTNAVAVTPITGDDITTDVLAIADAAAAAAADALTAASSAVTAANGKNKTYFATTPPTGGTYNDGDLWFDTDDGNKPYQRQSGAWVSVQDGAIAAATAASGAAVTTANAAQTTANSKNRIYYQTAQPTGGTYVVNDLWFDTDDGNKPYTFNGTTWVSAQDATIATAQTAASNALTAANGKNKVTYSTAQPGTAANTAGDIWFRTAGATIIEQWSGNGGTSWTQVQITGAVLTALDAGTITTGSLDAARIAAGTISASKLVVTNLSNLIDSGGFEGDVSSWGIGGGGITIPATLSSSPAGGTKGARFVGTGAYQAAYFQPYSGLGIGVIPGETYAFSVQARKTTAGNGTVWMDSIFKLDNASNNFVDAFAHVDVNGWPVGTWQNLSGILTVPAGANQMTPEIAAVLDAGVTVEWDNVVVRKAADGSLIVDGSISAGKIAANAVTAGTIAAGAVTANSIAAGAITANKLSIVVGGGNLVYDSNFESTMNTSGGWVVNAGTGVKDTAHAWIGTKAFKFVPGGSENYGYFPMDGSTNGAVTGTVPPNPTHIVGQTYTESVYVFASVAQALCLMDYGSSATQGPAVSVAANTWTRLTCTFVAGTDVFLSVRVPNRTGPVLGNLWIDAFQIELGDVPTAYAPATDEILPGTIRANQMVAGTITAGSGVIDNLAITNALIATGIDAGKITVGLIDANVIGAHTITSSKLIVSDLTNVLYDPTFKSPLGISWEAPAYASINATASRNGGPALVVALNGTDQTIFNLPTDSLTTQPGDAYRVAVSFKSTTAIPADGVQVNVRSKDGAGATTTLFGATVTPVTPATTLPSATWTTISGIVVIPTGGVTLSADLTFPAAYAVGTVTIDNVSMNRAANGQLIVDGSITADALSAGSVTAEAIRTGTLEAGFTVTGGLTVGVISITPGAGIVIPQPDGGVITLPADGTSARITADVVAYSLQVKGGFRMSGIGSVTGELGLANGASQPLAGPTITQYWPSAPSAIGTGDVDIGGGWAGLDNMPSDSTLWVYPTFPNSRTTLTFIKKSDLTIDHTITGTWSTGFEARGGISVMFDPASGTAATDVNYFVMGQDFNRAGDWYIYRIGFDGLKNAERRLGNSFVFQGFRPRILNDGVNVGYVRTGQSDDLTLRFFSFNLVNVVGGTQTIATGVGEQDLGDVVLGAAGSGAAGNTLWVSVKTSDTFSKVMCWTGVSTTAATRTSTFDFKRANGAQMLGMAYDAVQGRMVHYDNKGLFWTYSKFAQAITYIVRSQYTYYDGDATGLYPGAIGSGTTIINGTDVSGTASGAHETLPSPITSLTLERRSWPRIETAPPPDEQVTDSTRVDKANRIGLYMTLAASPATPFRYAYLPNNVDPITGIPTATRVVSGVDTMPTSGTPPITDGFVNASSAPGKITSPSVLRLDLQPKTLIDGAGQFRADGLIPPGTILMWGGPTAPSGWLLCDGTAVSRTTFIDLWAALSGGTMTTSPYGNGNGTSTFNLPNLQDRFPIGASGTKARGTNGGAATKTIATANLPPHSHTTPAHNHPYDVDGTGTGGTANAVIQRGSGAVAATTVGAYDPTTAGGGTSGDGGFANTALDVLNPYQAVNYIVKT